MLILSSTSDKIQVALTNAVATTQMSCFASYRDTTSTSITPIRNVLLTNNTSQVDLVGSPAASTQRVIDYLSVYNSDTAVNEVTVRFFDGTNGYRLMVVRLAVGEKLEYQEGIGFRVVGNGYSTKTVTVADGVTNTANFSMISIKQDVANTGTSANSFVEVPNLAVPVKQGKYYYIRMNVWYNTNATTTGSRFNLYGVSAAGFMYFQTLNTLNTTSISTAGAWSIYTGNFLSNASSAATSGNVCQIDAIIQADFDGTIYVMFGCEVLNGSVTVKANSMAFYQQTL